MFYGLVQAKTFMFNPGGSILTVRFAHSRPPKLGHTTTSGKTGDGLCLEFTICSACKRGSEPLIAGLSKPSLTHPYSNSHGHKNDPSSHTFVQFPLKL